MAAAKKLLAFALGALHALVCVAGTSEEPSCDTGENNKTCTTPAGHSVLQRASQLHVHSSSVAEEENKTAYEPRVAPSCGDKARFLWNVGYGDGGTHVFLGNMLQESCTKRCLWARSRDSAINGCTWSSSKTSCWAEKGMASRTKLDDWVSSFLPPPCTRVYFINNHPSDPVVKCDDLPLATRTAYGSPPCVGELYRVTLHGYTGTWLIRLDRSREGKCSLGCLHTGACRRSKKNGYAVFDGPGTQCGVA